MERRVIRVVPDLPMILDIHAKMREVNNFLVSSNPLAVFLREDIEVYLVDDVGILVAVNIQQGGTAHGHITFWDKRLRGREGLVYNTAQIIMERNDLHSIWTAVPKSARRVVAFAKRAGFKAYHEDSQVVCLKLDRRNHGT